MPFYISHTRDGILQALHGGLGQQLALGGPRQSLRKLGVTGAQLAKRRQLKLAHGPVICAQLFKATLLCPRTDGVRPARLHGAQGGL